MSRTRVATHAVFGTLAVMIPIGLASCGGTATVDPVSAAPDSSGSPVVADDGRPVGWTEETHSNQATGNYATVFPSDRVNRIDITIDAANWRAMQDDMTDMLGEFGSGSDGSSPFPGPPGDGGTAAEIPPETVPPEVFEACDGMQEGGACTVSVRGEVISGTCTMLSDGRLACIPEGMGGPPAGGGPPPVGGRAPSSSP